MPRKVKNLNDVVSMLVDRSYQILKWKLKAAMKVPDEELPEDYYIWDHDALNQVVEMVKPLMGSAQQIRKVEAETSKDIIKLIAKGKISIEEATSLMKLAKEKLSVEEKEMKVSLQNKLMKTLTEGER